MIIAIDGPSGTGKSTVAKGVAKRLGYTFFDTGAMYRSVAWKVLKEKIDPLDHAKIRAFMPQFHVDLRTDAKGERRYFIDGEDISEAIRQPHISSAASQVAIYPEVRSALVMIQREFGHRCNAVFEGRDMGTVVFPDADLKIFLTARPEVRAARRYRELLGKFPDLAQELSLEQILKEIEERDTHDSTRAISPLRQAADAILIDTSDCTVDQVIEQILQRRPLRKKKFPAMKLFYRFIYLLAKRFFKVFYRLKVYGAEHFRKGPGILVANHASFYDPPVLSISCPEEVHFLAKESLFRIPFLGWIIKTLNTHPLARGATDAHTFRLMIQLLQEGKKMILFPEGRRTPDGAIHPLQRGLAFLVQKAQVPIFPAYIQGTFEVWPASSGFPRPFGRITCIFGPPIQWEEFANLGKKEAEGEILARTDRAIRELQAQLEKMRPR